MSKDLSEVYAPKSYSEKEFVAKHTISLFDYPVPNNNIFTDVERRDNTEIPGQNKRPADNDLTQAVFTYESVKSLKEGYSKKYGKGWLGIAIAHKKSGDLNEDVSIPRTVKHKDGSVTKLNAEDHKVIVSMFNGLDDKNKAKAKEEAYKSKKDLSALLTFARNV